MFYNKHGYREIYDFHSEDAEDLDLLCCNTILRVQNKNCTLQDKESENFLSSYIENNWVSLFIHLNPIIYLNAVPGTHK